MASLAVSTLEERRLTGWWLSKDRDAVVEACTRMYWHIDRREWNQLAEVLDDVVYLEFTDLGARGADRPREAVIDSYRKTVAKFQATQHLLGSYLVTPEAEEGVASCSAQVQAVHRRANPTGDPLWILGCDHYYTVRRDAHGRWRIRSLRMTSSWGAGNQYIAALGPVE
jgi:hypothetical protein